MPSEKITAVLFDVDGTLVDSNDAHARAWVEAFAACDVHVDDEAVRRSIGMGADKLMPAVSGLEEESPLGSAISKRRQHLFAERFLPTVKPFPDARRLVSTIKQQGRVAVTASSAKDDELRALLDIADVWSLFDHTTSSDDAEHSKPDPDVIVAALARARVSPNQAIMIGDTPYDVEGARRAGVAVIAFRCGGWNDTDLAGATAIYDGPWDLVAHLAGSPLA
jgi:HAD superfamily hydrolase (TIGR01509 family)